MPCRLPLAPVLVVLAMLLGVASVAGSVAQKATPEATPTTLAWAPCGDDAPGWECAVLPVPRDYADPTGPTIDLALTRLPAADPGQRIGALLFNPGGPGGPGVGTLHQLGTLLFPEQTSARFDIVSFDPRGVGESGQISPYSRSKSGLPSASWVISVRTSIKRRAS